MQLGALKKEIKAQEQNFAVRLNLAVDALDDASAADLLLTVLRNDMETILGRSIAAHRQQVVLVFENWWDKYKVTLAATEFERGIANNALKTFLHGLRYV